MSDEDIEAEFRAFEVQHFCAEFRMFGLEPPVGLKCALALYILGGTGTSQIQKYMNRHLSQPVSSLENHHA